MLDFDGCNCNPINALWAPKYREDPRENIAFDHYALSFELAARALAEHPEAQGNKALQAAICRQYGVFLERLSENELEHLYNVADEIIGE